MPTDEEDDPTDGWYWLDGRGGMFGPYETEHDAAAARVYDEA